MSNPRKFDPIKRIKYCSRCDSWKSYGKFTLSKNSASGRDDYCKLCKNSYQNRKNAIPEVKEKLKAVWKSKEYRDKANARRRTPKGREARNKAEQAKYKNDPSYDMTRRIRRYLSHYIKATAGKFRHLEYDSNDLKIHIESRFLDGMSWDNRSEWHIDHIVALKCKNKDGSYYWNQDELADPKSETFKKAWSLDNLQPLWARDNCSKGNKP